MKVKITLLVILIALIGFMLYIARQSGTTPADLSRSLPGDTLLPHANATIDRIITLNTSADKAWPWIVQLGKGRSEWYAPEWLEALFVHDPTKRPARTIIPRFQHVKTGDIFDDYGPGKMRVLQFDPKKHIILYQLGDITKKLDSKNSITWLLMLEPIDNTHSRLVIRLRTYADTPLLIGLHTFGGLFDYATIVALEAGLNERFAQMK